MPRRAPPPPTTRVRLPPEARRRQLVDVAASLLDEHGSARLEFKEVAAMAGVTRPVVYRFFPSRRDLVEAVLDAFLVDLQARFHVALVATLGAPFETAAQAFIEACCDTIEARGKGAWQLMYAHGPDVEAATLGRAAQRRLLAPWLPRVAELSGLSSDRVALLARVFVAAGGAALDGWLEGTLPREEAVHTATRSVCALIHEFSPTVPR